MALNFWLPCLCYQATKQPILFSPIFSIIFSQFEQLKKKTNFFWSKTRFSSVLDQWKVCFLFQLLKLRKFHEWGKQDWLFGGLMSRTRYTINIYFSAFEVSGWFWLAIRINSWLEKSYKRIQWSGWGLRVFFMILKSNTYQM